MRKRLLILPVLVGLAGVLTFSVPAAADSSGGTPVTFEVGGATLDISVPAGSVDLGAVVASSSAQTVSANLGMVTVTDGRGGTTGWTVTAVATDFSGPQSISVSAVGGSGYTAGPTNVTGTAAVAGSDLNALYPPAAVQTATGVSGLNSASWNPTISVAVPANALVGTYGTSITHSVS
jgi:hypothetical protein